MNLDRYTYHAIKRKMLMVIDSLEKFALHKERDYGLWDIELVSPMRAMNLYGLSIAATLQNRRRAIEPLSSLYCVTRQQKARIEWRTAKAKIGEKITVLANSMVRPELEHIVQAWADAGFAFGSCGGIYTTIPNKSYERQLMLSTKGKEFLYPVVRLNAVDLWIDLWSFMISERATASAQMLALKKTMPDVFSKGNEQAGTGVVLRGKRLKRVDLDRIDASELEWAVDHLAGVGIAFAACQAVVPKADNLWLTTYLDPRVVGAVGARSDGDISQASFNAHTLTTLAEFQCRQIFSNAGGLLCNSDGERALYRVSVTQRIWRNILERYAVTDVLHPPFMGIKYLLEYWTSATKDSGNDPEEMVVIGQDIGLSEPIKSGADNLFGGSFTRIGNKCYPDMCSGAWYTMLSYVIYHIVWARKFKQAGILFDAVPLGDDFNFRVPRKDYDKAIEILSPYVKIKGTQGNQSKILGFMTDRKPNKMRVLVTPRIQKTLASAVQMKSEWAEILPQDLPDSGVLYLSIPASIEKAVTDALPVVKTLIYTEGATPKEVHDLMIANFGKVSHLMEYKEFLPEWFKFFQL